MTFSGSTLHKPLQVNEALAGQIIVVTGADQGYGRLLSAALSRAGASVVLVGRASETLTATAGAIEELGGQAIPLGADLSVPHEWMNVQDKVQDIFGELHGVIHLADRRATSDFKLLSENEWMDLFNANIKSTVVIAQLLHRRLPQTWLTVVGPHLDERGLHTYPQRDAIKGLVEHASEVDLRMNLVLPDRASSNSESLDRPLTDVVLTLAVPLLHHLRGTVLEVPMPPLPRPGQADLT